MVWRQHIYKTTHIQEYKQLLQINKQMQSTKQKYAQNTNRHLHKVLKEL